MAPKEIKPKRQKYQQYIHFTMELIQHATDSIMQHTVHIWIASLTKNIANERTQHNNMSLDNIEYWTSSVNEANSKIVPTCWKIFWKAATLPGSGKIKAVDWNQRLLHQILFFTCWDMRVSELTSTNINNVCILKQHHIQQLESLTVIKNIFLLNG